MSTHTPVLFDEAIEALEIKQDGVYVDATFGRGGHSAAILEQLGETGKLIAIDKDTVAVEHGRKRFAKNKNFTIVHASFSELESVVAAIDKIDKVDGVFLDLGVSSPQLDEAERGFSFMRDGPLDMRMDQTQTLDAKTWINTAVEAEIADVIYQYGEERYSRRIAKAIIVARQAQEITRTLQLAEIVKAAHPRWEKNKHPATRVFQAIRIYINQELDDIRKVLEASLSVLKGGGRLVVISFHSLEDRIVKKFIQLCEKGPEMPRHLPLTGEQFTKKLRKIGKAIKPGLDEIDMNVRSRSAVLRIAEKVSA